MSFIEIAPRFREAMQQQGLASARQFLDWPGIILSGHPDRHVLRVEIGGEHCILKKEHRVPWRDRLASGWAGFGWSSKSVREARVLEQLRAAGVPCPEVVASGEDSGQAFLLVREQRGMRDLRTYLAGALSARERRALAKALGLEVARIHAAGFDQPDLYAKHILVRATGGELRFCFLDWQRSRRRTVSWQRRLRDLAALDASLAEPLASDRLRLACLDAYLSERRGLAPPCARRGQAPPLAEVAIAIRRISGRLFSRRKVRELRQAPLPKGAQQLLWLQDSERLCIARDFYGELGGRLPSWLPQKPERNSAGFCVEHRLILLGSGRTAHLVQRWSGAGSWLGRGKFAAPEMERAAAIFRLQRFGVLGPRLLAMGHRRLTAWQRFSFLLTEPPLGPSLATVLRTGPADLREDLLAEYDGLMQRLDDAGFAFSERADPLQGWVVRDGRLALASVEALTRKREMAVAR